MKWVINIESNRIDKPQNITQFDSYCCILCRSSRLEERERGRTVERFGEPTMTLTMQHNICIAYTQPTKVHSHRADLCS